MAKKTEDSYNVPGLEKGLAIIELLSSSTKGLTMQDVISTTDVTSTTAYRILSTLLRLDYVVYNESGKTYKLSRKLLRLGYQTVGEHDVLETILPSLRVLRDKVKESVFFGVLGEEKGVFIEQAQSVYPFKFVLEAGASFDLHNSAPGKALLAYSSPIIRESFLNKMHFERCTKNTIITRNAYIKELEKVREKGYAVDIEESLIGVVCVGAPIFDFESKPVGAIWISGPNSRLNEDVFESVIKNLLETTSELSRQLGYENNSK